jgi:hypothetical protein
MERRASPPGLPSLCGTGKHARHSIVHIRELETHIPSSQSPQASPSGPATPSQAYQILPAD